MNAYLTVDPEFVAFYKEETKQPESVVRCLLAAGIEPRHSDQTIRVGFSSRERKAFETYLPSMQADAFKDTI